MATLDRESRVAWGTLDRAEQQQQQQQQQGRGLFDIERVHIVRRVKWFWPFKDRHSTDPTEYVKV